MNKPLKEQLHLNKIVETYFSCYLHLELKELDIILKIKDTSHTIYFCKCDIENMLLIVNFSHNKRGIIKLDIFFKSLIENAYIRHECKMFIISDNQVFEY